MRIPLESPIVVGCRSYPKLSRTRSSLDNYSFNITNWILSNSNELKMILIQVAEVGKNLRPKIKFIKNKILH